MPLNEDEKREISRLNCRLPLKYEKVCEDGAEGITVSTLIRDISVTGISFYSFEIIKLNTLIKISFCIKERDSISFVSEVKWIEKCSDEKLGKYIVGAEIDQIDEQMRQELVNFIGCVNIDLVMENIDVENVLDVNFVGGYPPMVKKFNKVIPAGDTPLSREIVQGLLLSILDDRQYKIFMKEREMNFIYSYKDTRFRVNLHFQMGNVEGTFRVIPKGHKSLKELGIPSTVESLLAMGRKGLVFVTGRTGSGKTTTLASMVEHINNTREGIIVCVEDPVEYVHTSKKCIIKQREVGKDTVSFYNAARNALRQNPDVLVIGEILDAETMEVALTMAESGTLVLTSFHAPNATYALDRVTSLFSADLQMHVLKRLSLVLLGIITQSLLPKADGKGSILATEVLVVNDALKRIIRHGDWKQIPTVLQTGKSIGMQSMEDSLRNLYEQGEIEGEYLEVF